MAHVASDIAFTPSVKAEQARHGSRNQYKRMERLRGWPTTVTQDLADFIAETRSFYLATANEEGQPYIQHRGGPQGFLKILDDKTLAFADYGEHLVRGLRARGRPRLRATPCRTRRCPNERPDCGVPEGNRLLWASRMN